MNRLFIFIFILSPFVYSNNENYCYAFIDYSIDGMKTAQVSSQFKKNKCKRDNILRINIKKFPNNLPIKDELSYYAYLYCRFDREILIGEYSLTCVLNSIERRTASLLG